jgi:hypothetical protein
MSDLPEREQVIIYLLQQIDIKDRIIAQLQMHLQGQTQKVNKPEAPQPEAPKPEASTVVLDPAV